MDHPTQEIRERARVYSNDAAIPPDGIGKDRLEQARILTLHVGIELGALRMKTTREGNVLGLVLLLASLCLATCGDGGPEDDSANEDGYVCTCEAEGTVCGPGSFDASSCSVAESTARRACEDQVEALIGSRPTGVTCECSGLGCDCPCGASAGGVCRTCDW